MAQNMAENSEALKRRQKLINNKYICGVVEGFYGRPWTLDQRKHLYERSNFLGLNTYLYAPKDDIKHRSAWREMYNVEEIAILRDLVESAKNYGVTFVYALSPGLDIVYSSAEEMETLKRKIEQVVQIGCDSFALLFDDIEPTMQVEDRKMFESFAHAHVHVTNAIFDHVPSKTFYFCPTEYCETRAVPDLASSIYLNTVGVNLRPDIHILWTGPRVISRYLTVEHLNKVSQVLRRKPLIWDNLHANDYDQKRVFMGPFKGRSVEIKNYTSGLLLNPNCKYEANFVPFHTLADWNAADEDCTLEVSNDPNESMMSIDDDDGKIRYNPEISARNAVSVWIPDFNAPSGPNIPQIPKIDPTNEKADFVLERQKSEINSTNTEGQPLQLQEIIQSVVAPEIIDQSEELNSLTVDYAQPMEEDDPQNTSNDVQDVSMTTVSTENDETEIVQPTASKSPDYNHIASFVNLHYLPFESGRQLRVLFDHFSWLMDNATVMRRTHQNIETLDPLQSEWLAKYDQVCESLSTIVEAFTFITESSNKALVSELIPYAWEAHGASVVLLAIARWMVQGFSRDSEPTANPPSDVEKHFWRYELDDEPWTTPGGFINDYVKLISKTDNVKKMFVSKVVLPLSIFTYDIRPYTAVDEEYIAELSFVTFTKDENLLRLRANIFCDRSFKPFILAGSQHNFMCEEVSGNSRKPMCFAAAHINGAVINEFLENYKETLKQKYSADTGYPGFDMSQIVREMDNWFPKVSSDVFARYPSWVDTHFAMDSYDAVPMRRLIQTISVTLAMNGSPGMFVTIPLDEADRQQYFLRLGFTTLGQSECSNYAILGHELNQPVQSDNATTQ